MNSFNALILLAVLISSGAMAETATTSAESGAHGESRAETDTVLFPDENHETHYRNYVAAFAGYTSEERGEGGLTLGGEFTRRISKHFGVGLVAERVYGDVDAWVALAGTGYRTERWKFFGGIGFEDPQDHGKETLFRLGITHVIPWQPRTEWLVTGAVDFVDGESVWLLGLALGYGF